MNVEIQKGRRQYSSQFESVDLSLTLVMMEVYIDSHKMDGIRELILATFPSRKLNWRHWNIAKTPDGNNHNVRGR